MNVDLHLGDCLDILPTLKSKSIDAIIADLPWGSGHTACEWDEQIPMELLWEQYKRILKPAGAVVLFSSQPFTSELIISNPSWYKHEWIWDKMAPSCPAHSNTAPKRIHENILVFRDGTGTYNPIFWKVGRRLATRSRAKRALMAGTEIRYDKEFSYKPDETLRYPQSIISLSRQSAECNSTKRIHPTQKPVALLAYFIRIYTNRGEIILDNVMGSGSTGVACIQTERGFVGIEADPQYFGLAQEWIEAEQEKAWQREMKIA